MKEQPPTAMLAELAEIHSSARGTLEALNVMGELDVGTAERDCVYGEGAIKLYRYRARSQGPPGASAPLLICYAMVNRPSILDLQPDRSLIRDLLAAGIDLYLIDWGYPGGGQQFTGLDEYVNGSLHRCVSFILKRYRIKSLNLLGVCQGGTLSLCYAALHPARVANLITMVTPVDFHTPDNLLSKWARHVDLDALTASGNVPGHWLTFIFLSLMPYRLTHQKYVGVLRSRPAPIELKNFMRMEQWIFDSPDQPARAFREFVRWLYVENRLVRGKLSLGGRPVRLQKITQPVLNIYALKDHIVPPAAAHALGAHVRSRDFEVMAVNAGHIGVYVSRRARCEVSERIVGWLQQHAAREQHAASERAAALRKPSAAAVAARAKRGAPRPRRLPLG